MEIENKNKERRGPNRKKKRYFKIPLCRNFVRKVRDHQTHISATLGQKLKYDTHVTQTL